MEAYKDREWKLYDFVVHSEEERSLQEACQTCPLEIIGMDSPRTKKLEREHPDTYLSKVLFYDYEQEIHPEIGQCYGVNFSGMLKEKWRDHKPGSLVMQITKISKDFSRMTWMVEVT